MLCALLLIVGAIEADPQLKEGQQLMEAFDYEKAVVVFDAVSKREGLTEPDRAVALVWLGLAAAEARDTARASVAFEEAVRADPLISLPRDSSPKIKALLDDARARVRLRPTVAPTTTPTTTPTDAPPSAPVVEPVGGGLFPVAVGTLVVGGVVALAGGAVWAAGLMLRQQAVDEPFQSKAAELRDQSVTAQIGGQVTTGVGVLALVAGGALFAVDAME